MEKLSEPVRRPSRAATARRLARTQPAQRRPLNRNSVDNPARTNRRMDFRQYFSEHVHRIAGTFSHGLCVFGEE